MLTPGVLHETQNSVKRDIVFFAKVFYAHSMSTKLQTYLDSRPYGAISELARAVGVHPSTVLRWASSGRVNPDKVRKVAEITQLELLDLLLPAAEAEPIGDEISPLGDKEA